jgi:hypothetical protein
MEAVIPLSLKIGFTLFVCALVPIYWRQYGPANFLWFSDIALLGLVPALWLENALIVSMMAVAVVFFEAIWNVDFFARLLTGKSSMGLGYDRRAFFWQTVVALVVLPLSYLVSNAQENVNWVYGFGQKPQTILPAPLFVILLMLLFPLAVYLPTHLFFARIFRAAGS